MRYCAERDCTDFGGRFFKKGEIAELSPNVRHSAHLIPMERAGSEIPAPSAGITPKEESVSEASVKTTMKKRRKRKAGV